MSEFDGIEGIEGWRTKLLEILDAAEEVAEQEDWPPRREVSRRLKDFILKSSPNTADILELDRIAKETRSALLRTTIAERLESIANRQADLVRLTKSVSAITEENLQSAASIRLERARRVVNSMTTTISQLREFGTTLEPRRLERSPDSSRRVRRG